ncbi:MAG: TIGR02611 family protein [Gaiellaceae bacterium]
MHGWPGGRHVWKIGVAVVGLIVVVAGIVMLVTPGPGWLVIFLGFAIWATEFAWANSVASFVRRNVTACASWIRRQPRWLLVAAGSVCLLAVAVAIVVLLALL